MKLVLILKGNLTEVATCDQASSPRAALGGLPHLAKRIIAALEGYLQRPTCEYVKKSSRI